MRVIGIKTRMNCIAKTRAPPARLLTSGEAIALSAALPLILALAAWLSWTADNTVLRRQAEMVTSGLTSASARIRAVSDWVYHHRGFAKNHRFFTIPALGPTPIDVLAAGGDCADKSRLVSAMLRQLGIDFGPGHDRAMFRRTPIHTVVEAEYENGRMVVDPVWDVDYPAADGRFLGVRDLAATKFGPERVAELQRGSPEERQAPPYADYGGDLRLCLCL